MRLQRAIAAEAVRGAERVRLVRQANEYLIFLVFYTALVFVNRPEYASIAMMTAAQKATPPCSAHV